MFNGVFDWTDTSWHTSSEKFTVKPGDKLVPPRGAPLDNPQEWREAFPAGRAFPLTRDCPAPRLSRDQPAPPNELCGNRCHVLPTLTSAFPPAPRTSARISRDSFVHAPPPASLCRCTQVSSVYATSEREYTMVITSSTTGRSISTPYSLLKGQTTAETTAYFVLEHTPEKCSALSAAGKMSFNNV